MTIGNNMIEEIIKYEAVNPDNLLDVYSDTIRSIANGCAVEDTNMESLISGIEPCYLCYIKDIFFNQSGASMWVYIENGVWVSALRMYEREEGKYVLEGMATHHDYKDRGFDAKLLNRVIRQLKLKGALNISYFAQEDDESSIKTLLDCGFKKTENSSFEYSFIKDDVHSLSLNNK